MGKRILKNTALIFGCIKQLAAFTIKLTISEKSNIYATGPDTDLQYTQKIKINI